MSKCAITGLEFDDNLCSPVWYNGELVCAWVRRAIDSSDREEFIRILSLFRNVKVTEIQVDIIEILHPEYLTDTCKILYSLALWMRDKFWLRGFIIHFETAKDRLLFNPDRLSRCHMILDHIIFPRYLLKTRRYRDEYRRAHRRELRERFRAWLIKNGYLAHAETL